MTLSKIIRLKEDLFNIFLKEKKDKKPHVQLYSIAHAWVLFERLILKNLVRKQDRRIYLAVCLLISIKIIEINGFFEGKARPLQLEKDINLLIKG